VSGISWRGQPREKQSPDAYTGALLSDHDATKAIAS